MVLTRHVPALAGLVALAGCLPPEPQLVTAPLSVRAAQPDGEVRLPGVTLDVQRAAFSLADLVLRGPDAEPVGDWADREVVEVLGGAEHLGSARVYEGAVRSGVFSLVGDPGLDLRGVAVTDDGAVVPFDLAAEITLGLPVSVTLDVDAAAPPALRWVVDLEPLLAPIDFAAAAGGPLELSDEVLDQLRVGLTADGTWSILGEEGTDP